jgi:hypothetical protein
MVSVLGAPDYPVRPLTVGPVRPGGRASPSRKTREQRVGKRNFSHHTGLSGVHCTGTVHCPVRHDPNG